MLLKKINKNKPRKHIAINGCVDCKRLISKTKPYFGKGKKGILFVTPYNYIDNERITGDYRSLRNECEGIGIDLAEDCYIASMSPCINKDTKQRIDLQSKTYLNCSKDLIKTIKSLKPKVVIPLGSMATKFVICSRIDGRLKGSKGADFLERQIPDRDLNCWVAPIYGTYEIAKNTDNYGRLEVVLGRKQKRLFKEAIDLAKKELPVLDIPKIEYLWTEEDACEWLSLQHDLWQGEEVSFDLETTGLKPQSKKQKIRCIAFRSKDVCGVMPFFTGSPEFREQLKKIMTNPKIKKIAQKLQYEDGWIYEKADKVKYRINGWYWDTLLAEHCINSKAKISLKYQTYVNLGVLNYDGDVDKFLTTEEKSCNAVNRVFDAPLDKLMEYCAYDTIYTQEAYYRQKEWFETYPQLMEGLQLLIDGSITLSTMHLNGQGFDTKKAIASKVKLEKEIRERTDNLKKKDYGKGWDGQLSGANLFNHVYKTLGLINVENKKTAKGTEALDVEVLKKMNHPFTKELIKIKQLYKVVYTYLESYLREECNGRVHPHFSLDRTSTFRSSCLVGETMINTTEGQKQIKDVVEGDLVYCFDNNLKPAIRKVMWSGKTGHRKVIRVHFDKILGKKGYVDLTPEHKIRAFDGEYIEAKDSLDTKTKRFIGSYIGGSFHKRKKLDYYVTKIEKLEETQDVYDITVEDYHNFVANGLCVHNSQNPNAQNVPKRNKMIKKIIRECIVPKKGHRFMAWDYKALETIIAGCNYRDKAWLEYQKDLKADMHWDWTVLMFDLDEEFIDEMIIDKIKGEVRGWVKNQAIFPSLFGMSPFSVANNLHLKMKEIPLMWEWFLEKGWDDIEVFRKHIEAKYVYYWEEWFVEYKDLREEDWEKYRKDGFADNLTGFRYQGALAYTEFCNYKIQGSASHVKLWTAIETQKEIDKRGLKSKLVWEIHDEIGAEVPENETIIMNEIVQEIGTKKVRGYWKWIITPLVMDCEASPVDGTWQEMDDLENILAMEKNIDNNI